MAEKYEIVNEFLDEVFKAGGELVEYLPDIGPRAVEAFDPRMAGLGFLSGKMGQGMLEQNGNVFKAAESKFLNDTKLTIQRMAMQPHQLDTMHQGNLIFSETAQAMGTISASDSFAKVIGDKLPAGTTDFGTGYIAGAIAGEQDRQNAKMVAEIPNSFGGKGIPQFGNNRVNQTLIEGPQRFGEHLSDVLNNPGQILNGPQKNLIKPNNPNNIGKSLNLEARKIGHHKRNIQQARKAQHD